MFHVLVYVHQALRYGVPEMTQRVASSTRNATARRDARHGHRIASPSPPEFFLCAHAWPRVVRRVVRRVIRRVVPWRRLVKRRCDVSSLGHHTSTPHGNACCVHLRVTVEL